MRVMILAVLMGCPLSLIGQSGQLNGTVLNESAEPLPFATVVLLNPSDSTLAYFGITNSAGNWAIKEIRKGSYLLQFAFVGYETQYHSLAIPRAEGESYGTTILRPRSVSLGQVDIVGDYIPIQIRHDTLEFNSKAFKTRPDANVEELLKKLPGIEVDRSGNIKALGENVSKVFVDGKEFFGNDPKVATRNLPADAVDKVQVYDRKSDMAEFTGIDDGTREKAINLVLDEDKKQGWFGDANAGYGPVDHYDASLKAFRFNDKVQLAGLGMQNNINRAGFSMSDYLNFSGGLQSIAMGGGSGRIEIRGEGGLPVDFGQQVTGLTTSGAAGANFSYSPEKQKRFFISYLANGSKKDLKQETDSWNYTPVGSFNQFEDLNEIRRDTAHRFSLGVRYRVDSTRNVVADGNVALTTAHKSSHTSTSRLTDENPINRVDNRSLQTQSRLNGTFNGSYVSMRNRARSVFNISGNLNLSKELSGVEWTNGTSWYNPALETTESQFQNNSTDRLGFGGNISLTQKLGDLFFLIPEIQAGNRTEVLDRVQGFTLPEVVQIDSLSPRFESAYPWMRPALTLKRSTRKTQMNLILGAEMSNFQTSMGDEEPVTRPLFHFTPGFMFDHEFRTGRRLGFNFQSSVNTPTTSQLLPVVNNFNPLSLFYGNINLKPEHMNRLNLNWILFDQFSFTSLFVNLSGTYTRNKINWSREIDPQFRQTTTLVNVKDDYQASGSLNFSTPVKKLGIKVNIDLRESYNRGLNLVNGTGNVQTSFRHSASFGVDNRKKDKWDIASGVSLTMTDARYSLQESLNNRYFDMSWYADLRYTPNDHWNFQASADLTRYLSMSFDESVNIPLLGAEVSYSFLENHRGILSLRVVDLLNRNTGLERISEINYLLERRSNTVGRMVMLSFKYKLNKLGDSSGGFQVKTVRR